MYIHDRGEGQFHLTKFQFAESSQNCGHSMADAIVAPLEEEKDSPSATALVDIAKLKLRTVEEVVGWTQRIVTTIEGSLTDFYVDSLEIDLEASPGVKLVIKNRAGQSTGLPR